MIGGITSRPLEKLHNYQDMALYVKAGEWRCGSVTVLARVNNEQLNIQPHVLYHTSANSRVADLRHF
jgi:hypothetical protein